MPHLSPTDFTELAATASIFSSSAAPETVAHDLDGIPRLTRTLGQVSHSSAEVLRARADGASGPGAVHAEALRLLAGRGFAAERLRRAVAEIEARSPFVARSARHRVLSGDPAQLLALQRAAVASRAADDARLSANAGFRRRFCAAVDADILDSRSALLNALRARTDPRLRGPDASPDGGARTPHRHRTPRAPGTPRSAAAAAATPRSARATPRSAFTPRTPHAAGTPRTPGTSYAGLMPEADADYVSAILSLLTEGDAPSVASVFYETALVKQESPHLLEAFAVLANVANFAHAGGPPAPHVRVTAARLVLEDHYAERTGVLPVKPRQASAVAVRAGVLEYVRALTADGKLADIGSRPHLSDQLSLWAQVFFCFRVGNLEAALLLVTAALEAGNREVEHYRALLERFLEKRITADGADVSPGFLSEAAEYNHLIEEYRTKVWQSGDAYYRACYVLLARLELAPAMSSPTEIHKSISDSFTAPAYPLQSSRQRTVMPFPDEDFSALFGSVEDYMWLRLFTCRTALESGVITNLPELHFVELDQIQKELVACGPAHFDDNGTQPFLYAFVLICCGLYWDAVQFLSSQGDEHVIGAAAHIAMILHLLQWMESRQDYGAVVWNYIAAFMQRQPKAAAAYVLTIRDKESVTDWLTQLIFETGEFRVLLGSANDPTHKGEVEDIVKKMPRAYAVLSCDDVEDLRCDVSARAAVQASDREDYLQAVEMYALANERSSSLRMLLQGIAVVVDSKSGPNRELALSRGRETYTQMQNANETGPLIRSLRMVLSIASFFDDYHARRFNHAWSILSSLGLLPLSPDTIVARRTDLLPSSNRYDQSVRRCAALLLRAALDICEHALVSGNAVPESRESSAFQGRGPVNTGLPTRSQIKSLVTFSGLMGLAETEVNARLVRIELLMA